MTATAVAEVRAQLGRPLPPPWRWRCPCGCAGPYDEDCVRHRPRSVEGRLAAGRAAWHHLRHLELLDGEGWQARVLEGATC